MKLTELLYPFAFLPVCLFLYYVLPKRCRNAALLAASLLFFAWGTPEYLVLLVLDGSQPLTAEDEELLRETESYPRLILCNKADRGAAFDLPGALRISAVTGEGMDALRQELARRAGMPCELPLTSERHMRLARAAAQHLQTAADALENGQPLDLAAIDLHAALDCLGEVTGDRVDEKLLDSVFSRFCVGK